MNNIYPVIILLSACLFGITMKVADLLDEHGLKWFKGSDILFGILWGSFGSLIIYLNPTVANIYLSLIVAFILRYRIDYLNHGIAATLMILTFLAYQIVDWRVFGIFFFIFAIFGLIHDLIQNENKFFKENSLIKSLFNLRFHYYLFPFLYSLVTGFWLVFFTVGINMLSYELTMRYAKTNWKVS